MTPHILTPETRIVWTDTETFGLEDRDPVIEVAFAITDLNLHILDSETWLVWDFTHESALIDLRRRAAAGDKGANIVLDMHTSSGLFDDAKAQGTHPWLVEEGIVRWLTERGIAGSKDELAGSTVEFDKGQFHRHMPQVEELFSHRVLNVSSFKVACSKYNPQMFTHMAKDAWGDAPKTHRALDDIKQSISEYGWYVENFLFVDGRVLGDDE